METAKRQAQLLHLYLLELKNTLKKVNALNVLQRNPYIRSKAAKLVLQEVSESMQHCLDAQLVFLASVSRLQLSDEAGLKACGEPVRFYLIFRMRFCGRKFCISCC